jgi:hypothetical protein
VSLVSLAPVSVSVSVAPGSASLALVSLALVSLALVLLALVSLSVAQDTSVEFAATWASAAPFLARAALSKYIPRTDGHALAEPLLAQTALSKHIPRAGVAVGARSAAGHCSLVCGERVACCRAVCCAVRRAALEGRDTLAWRRGSSVFVKLLWVAS